MNKISISKCVNGAWDLTAKHWIMCVIVLVATVFVSIVSSMASPQTVVYSTGEMTAEEALQILKTTMAGSFGVASLAAYVVQFVLYAGLYKMALNAYNGLKADTTAYKMPATTYLKFVAACITYGIIVGVGSLFCVIPGIFLAVRLLFAMVILLDEPETEFTEAFKKSWTMTAGSFWSLLGLGVVSILINIVGLLCCCVGMVFTLVMGMFMLVSAYYTLKGNRECAMP